MVPKTKFCMISDLAPTVKSNGDFALSFQTL
jgi:hypothetical protein